MSGCVLDTNITQSLMQCDIWPFCVPVGKPLLRAFLPVCKETDAALLLPADGMLVKMALFLGKLEYTSSTFLQSSAVIFA